MQDSAYIELARHETAPAREQRVQDREDMADRDADIFQDDVQQRIIDRVASEQRAGMLGSLFPKMTPEEAETRKRHMDQALETYRRVYKNSSWM